MKNRIYKRLYKLAIILHIKKPLKVATPIYNEILSEGWSLEQKRLSENRFNLNNSLLKLSK